jgi:NADH-quinone oxidoreductase subunit F
MSQKILLDKINIPGIKPTKYTVKTGLCFSRKSLENINTDEVVEEVKTSGLRGRGGAGFCRNEMEFY